MKLWLKILLIAVFLVVVAFFGASAYLGHSMTLAHRVPVGVNPGQVGLAYEDVSFPSAVDHLQLRGWLLPAPGASVIVMVHGESEHRADTNIGMLDIAAALVAHNFNVLLFDLRGHGESAGRRISGGYFEKRDVLGAIQYLKERGFQRIGVLGFSLGAVTGILASAGNRDVLAVVSDSAFAGLQDIMETEFRKRTHFPPVFLRPVLVIIKLLYGVDFAAIRPESAVPDIAAPLFVIHGEEDAQIPVQNALRLFQAAREDGNQLWIAPAAGHVQAYRYYPEEYVSRVTEFFDRSLGP